jgi:queuine tRNA-ribosyltransferase
MATSDAFSFEVVAQDGDARAGVLHTPHGDLFTPLFAPVGTQATVKALTPAQLEELGVSLVLANTYHLFLRPGTTLIAEAGGIHHFMDWPRPMLTDSGGYQIFSLARIRRVDEDGVTFRSHIDGSYQRLTPELAMSAQEDIGADIIMSFDECAPPYDRAYNEAALRRTHAWARRCLEAKHRPDQALFGIVQGGVFDDLREQSAAFISALPFDGVAIGGLSVGESKTDTYRVLDLMKNLLPIDRPRYLMGVGAPADMVNAVRRGVDIFDCVQPTRLARHGAALSHAGHLSLRKAEFQHDERPIEPGCTCYTCTHFTRSYLRHLLVSKEMLFATLVSMHNIHFLVTLMSRMRESILAGRFNEFAAESNLQGIVNE